MGPYHGAVNDEMFQIWVLGKMMMHSFPDTSITPAGKPPVNAVPFAILLGQQSPLGTAASHPEHAFNEAAAVSFMAHVHLWATTQESEDFRPLFIG
jgi:hypothetical protein